MRDTNGKPSLKPTLILTASSSSLKPQEAIGKAKAESSLWRDYEIMPRTDGSWDCELRLYLTTALSIKTPDVKEVVTMQYYTFCVCKVQ